MKSIDEMNRDELRKLAAEKQLPGRGKMTKPQLLAALKKLVKAESTPVKKVPGDKWMQRPSGLSNKQRKLRRQKRKAQGMRR